MTEQEKLQADLRKRYLIEEARLTYQKLAKGGFVMGGTLLSRTIQGVQVALVHYIDLDGNRKWFVTSPADGAFSEDFDFGSPAEDWNIYSIIPLNLGGWAVALRNNTDSNLYRIFFIGTDGQPIQQLEYTTSDFRFGSADGDVIFVMDYQVGLIWTWRGDQEVHLYTGLLADSVSAEFNTEVDRSVLGGGLILKVVREPEPGEVEHHWSILKDGVATLINVDTLSSGTVVELYAHHRSPLIVAIRRDINTGAIFGWAIMDQNGDTIPLSTGNIESDAAASVNIEWYGVAGHVAIELDSETQTRLISLPVGGTISNTTYAKTPGVTYTNYLYTQTPNNQRADLNAPINGFLWLRTVAANAPVVLAGELTDLAEAKFVYRFGIGQTKEFSLSIDLSPSIPIHMSTVPRLVNDKILIPIGIGGDWRILVLTQGANTNGIVSPLDFQDRGGLLVEGIQYPYLLQDPDENPIAVDIDLTLVSIGWMVLYWNAADNMTILDLINGEPHSNPNYRLEQLNYYWRDDESGFNVRAEAGPILIWSANLDGVLAWTPTEDMWLLVYPFVAGSNTVQEVYSTRTRFNPLGKGGDQFVIDTQNGDKYLVNSEGRYYIDFPNGETSTVRIGDTGFYIGYYDEDRSNLFTIKHYGRSGQLISTTETQYTSRSSREFIDSRALIELTSHSTNSDLRAVWIGSPIGGFIKEVSGTNLDASFNDWPWYD